MKRIVTIGEGLVEVMRTERDRPLDSTALFMGPFPSGAPAILASAVARLGGQAGFVGTVGNDDFGRCVLNRLQADGVDCSAVRRLTDRLTGIAFVAYRSDGSRSFLFHLPQSAAADVAFEQIPAGYLAETGTLHIMGSALTLSDSMRQACYRVAQMVHDQGGTVSLDPNLRPELMPAEHIRKVCAPIVALADIVLPSGSELLTLTGTDTVVDGIRSLCDQGVRLVALKQGDQGSTLYTPDRILHVPPFRVTEVDPTGAGDCFDAALLLGLAEDWPLELAGLFANAVGALATTRLGPMEGIFDRATVWEFMSAQGTTISDC